MDSDALEHLYVIGEYSLLLEKISKLAYNHPSTKLTDLEKAICLSYHNRALIRLGKVNEAENLIRKIPDINFDESFSISSLIYLTSIINLQNTQGNSAKALKNGLRAIKLVVQKEIEFSNHLIELSFWLPFLYFLIGVAYYYQTEHDLAYVHFQKSLDINQTNLYIKAKNLYYIAFMEQMKGDLTEYYKLLEKSLNIFKSIDAQQGMAWILAWQGQHFMDQGDMTSANNKFSLALGLFRSISDIQGVNLVNSLIGLMLYQQGELEQAEEILEQSFHSSVKIGNPMILSYCFLPLVLLYTELAKRSKAQECIQNFQELSKTTSNETVKLHGSLAEAIFLKSSSRFIDKGKAQKTFHKLLEDSYSEKYPRKDMLPTSDKDFSFLIIYHLIELYIEEFKLTEDKKIMLEAQQLIDNHILRVDDQKFAPELVKLSLLNAKMLIVNGEIKNALGILDQAKQDANTHNLHRLEEKIGFEITQIESEYQKWDAVFKSSSLKDRIDKVRLEEYLKEAQKIKLSYL